MKYFIGIVLMSTVLDATASQQEIDSIQVYFSYDITISDLLFIETLDRELESLLTQYSNDERVFVKVNEPSSVQAVQLHLTGLVYTSNKDSWISLGSKILGVGVDIFLFHFPILTTMLRRTPSAYMEIGMHFSPCINKKDKRLAMLGKGYFISREKQQQKLQKSFNKKITRKLTKLFK